jgi:hypothetical protein
MLLLFIIAALIVALIWFWMLPSRKGAEPASKPLHSEKSHRRQYDLAFGTVSEECGFSLTDSVPS